MTIFVCDICDKKFLTKSDLTEHVNKIHQPIPNQSYTRPRKARLMCPLQSCEKEYLTYHQLRLHLLKDHMLNIDFEECIVDSLKDFEKWKQKIEQQTKSSYILDTGDKKLATGVKRYYNCHYTYKIKSECKRTNKCMESNKTYKACPSRLEIIMCKINGILKLIIKFWKTHYGHESNIERNLLNKEQNTQEVSQQRIRDSIEDESNLKIDDRESLPEHTNPKIYYATKDRYDESEELRCKECKQAFIHKKNLYRHLRKFHQIEPIVKKKPTYICNNCDKKFATKSSLLQHMRNFHKPIPDHGYTQAPSRKTRLICPLENCMEEFLSYRQLRLHLEKDHKSNIDFEELTFDSIEDFGKWKIRIEQQTMALFTLDTGEKKLVTGVKRYYNCHRSHNFKSKGKNLKTKKSKKIDKACPARLELNILKGKEIQKLNVKFWKTHYGHGPQIRRPVLDKVTRTEIAGKIKDGVPFEKILESVRGYEMHNNYCEQLRTLKRKDLHNIARAFKSDNATNRRKD